MATRRRETPRGTTAFVGIGKQRARPVCRISRFHQAVEYGRMMGAEALQRQWRGGFSGHLYWSVMRDVERARARA